MFIILKHQASFRKLLHNTICQVFIKMLLYHIGVRTRKREDMAQDPHTTTRTAFFSDADNAVQANEQGKIRRSRW